jgi:hypothetical protein
MLQGDDDWRRLTGDIFRDDFARASEHNQRASAESRLSVAWPVPFLGPIMTAPVVLLLTHPALDSRVQPGDYAFQRAGWPLSMLHPDAPAGLGEWWEGRLGRLVDEFGPQHVANSVAAAFLTPWPSVAFESQLRLPSRERTLALAASAAARDAVMLILRGGELWTEDADIAALPPSRRFYPRTWHTTRVDPDNLGEEAWSTVCRRVAVHAWL